MLYFLPVPKLIKKVSLFFYYLGVFLFLFLSSRVLATNTYTVIPLEFCSQEPIAKIILNGYPTKLIVDLGTSGYDLTLSKAIVNQSHAKLLRIDNKNYFINYRREKYPIKNYLIKNVELGEFKLNNLLAVEFPGMNFFSDNPQKLDKVLNNGTIGIKLLEKFNVIFDYPQQRLVLLRKGKNIPGYDIGSWIKIPFHSASDNTLLIAGKINNIPAKILIDSGNNALTMTRFFLQKLNSTTKIKFKKQSSQVIINDLTMGNFHLKSQSYQIHNTHPEADISLGWDFFKDHLIYLDFEKNYMAIKQ